MIISSKPNKHASDKALEKDTQAALVDRFKKSFDHEYLVPEN